MSKDEREEEKKPKFRIVDRRQADDEESAYEAPSKPKAQQKDEVKAAPVPDASPQSHPQQSADTGEEPELTDAEKEELNKQVEASLTFKNTVIFILRTLSEQIWIHLGLVPNPISGLTIKNLPEARKSIDLFENIAKFAEGEFDKALLMEVNRLLMDLKLNYTNQLGV